MPGVVFLVVAAIFIGVWVYRTRRNGCMEALIKKWDAGSATTEGEIDALRRSQRDLREREEVLTDSIDKLQQQGRRVSSIIDEYDAKTE